MVSLLYGDFRFLMVQQPPPGRPFHWLFLLPVLADTLALCLAGVLAYLVRTSAVFIVDPYLLNPRQYVLLLGSAILLWHGLLLWRGGYGDRSLLFRIDELLLQFNTSIILLLLVMAVTFLYRQYDFSRLIVFFGWMFFVLLGNLFRQISHRLRETLHRRGIGRRRVAVAGSGDRKRLFRARIDENPGLGLDLVEIPGDRPMEEFLGGETLDEIFVFEDQVAYERIWEWRELSRNPTLIVHLVPPFGNLYLRNLSGGFFDGMVMISLDSPASRRWVCGAKRAIDLLVTGIFSLVLCPLMALIAVLVKFDSRGPVLFRQTRVGLHGGEFTILKFRTMVAEADPYAVTPTDRTDPRITRFGRFLRSTGLDELPQLWNVLRGDMSLVGPRPEMPFIVGEYSSLEAKRLKVRPGITGLWQVYARSANLPIHSHVEYDLYYIENLSLTLDLMILLDTIPTLVLRTGI